MSRLAEVDLSQALSSKEERHGLERAQARLTQLRLTLGGQIGEQRIGPPLLVLLEGWDASGKGGAIKRLVAELDARHVRVCQFAAPSPDEKRHHFLWRFWDKLPGWGGMAIFDRPWYGRALVERVEGQLRRFERRERKPLKSWKLTDEDWRNRDKRGDYEQAVEDMLAHTDQPAAPWSVIAAESKGFARVEVIETVIARIEQGMREQGIEPPEPLTG